MKFLNFSLLLSLAIVISAFTIKNIINWQIAEGFSIKFKGKDAEGVFRKMNGDISFNEINLAASKFSVVIDVESISTGNFLKNRHARGENWFDAKKYPKITFNSSKFSKSKSGFEVEGILEMHGIKRSIKFPFTFTSNVFKGNFKVNRIDYGIGTMEGMSKRVGNEIFLDISVPVNKK
jgi:polyisoprenoid-binding protein YceI